jgi:hypothetical protein
MLVCFIETYAKTSAKKNEKNQFHAQIIFSEVSQIGMTEEVRSTTNVRDDVCERATGKSHCKVRRVTG